jgi:cytochrome c5
LTITHSCVFIKLQYKKSEKKEGKMKKIFKTSVYFFAASVISISGAFVLNAVANDESAQILNTRCTSCHGIGKVKKANHDKKGWEETIMRMMDKKKFGKRLDQKQVEKLADYILSSK